MNRGILDASTEEQAGALLNYTSACLRCLDANPGSEARFIASVLVATSLMGEMLVPKIGDDSKDYVLELAEMVDLRIGRIKDEQEMSR